TRWLHPWSLSVRCCLPDSPWTTRRRRGARWQLRKCGGSIVRIEECDHTIIDAVEVRAILNSRRTELRLPHLRLESSARPRPAGGRTSRSRRRGATRGEPSYWL